MRYARELASVWWRIGDRITEGSGPMRIGGCSLMYQWDALEVAAEAAGNQPEDWGLTGSWAPEGEGEYGGSFVGTLEISIRREDLAVLRFDRLSLYLQQAGRPASPSDHELRPAGGGWCFSYLGRAGSGPSRGCCGASPAVDKLMCNAFRGSNRL